MTGRTSKCSSTRGQKGQVNLSLKKERFGPRWLEVVVATWFRGWPQIKQEVNIYVSPSSWPICALLDNEYKIWTAGGGHFGKVKSNSYGTVLCIPMLEKKPIFHLLNLMMSTNKGEWKASSLRGPRSTWTASFVGTASRHADTLLRWLITHCRISYRTSPADK